eukprot:TRINITY_DN12614_c1_g1_i2.p1 TRINITY_DN12614_c1_g1~~TRINITY_DN12614_c1_g1_i2.p1  ORF type:complete len:328 (+),score=43.29 TRINITY_DN12614_c1_g1_i2:41-985(+)
MVQRRPAALGRAKNCRYWIAVLVCLAAGNLWPWGSAYVAPEYYGCGIRHGAKQLQQRAAALRAGTKTALRAEASPEQPVARSNLVRQAPVLLGYAGLYAGLLYWVSGADTDEGYRSRVKRVISTAVPQGGLRVLEVGIGSGPNMDLYPAGTRLVGLDRRAAEDERISMKLRAKDLGLKFNLVSGDVQELPFKDESFDAVVLTKVLCSVQDPSQALKEISRVLRPGGRLAYVEHVAADTGSILEGQQLLMDPLQQAVAGNCHLHRDTDALIGRSTKGQGASGGAAALFDHVEGDERYQIWRMWPITQQAAGVAVK